MGPLRLDFRRRRRPARLPGILLLLAGLAAAAVLGAAYEQTRRDMALLEDALAELSRAAARRSAPRQPGDVRLLGEQIRRANLVLGQLGTPWDELFSLLESAHNRDIALLAIEPDAARGSVRITAEARQVAAMHAYLGRLRATRKLSQVLLQSHQIQLQDPDKPVRFTLAARWVP